MNNNDYEIMNTDNAYYVAMANQLIKSKSSLGLNSAKLVRAAIMQIKPDDTELKPCKISIQEFIELLELKSKTRIYEDIEKITKELMAETIFLYDKNKPEEKWKAIHWVSTCERDGQWILIKLDPEIKPYVIGLVKNYTQYELRYILTLKSVYAIKLFELIKCGLNEKELKKYGECKVEVQMDVLRRATDTENKYTRVSNLKEKVIDIAINEINQVPGGIRITECKDLKYAQKITSFLFTVKSFTADFELSEKAKKKVKAIKKMQKERKRQEEEQGYSQQMSIEDFMD